MMHWETVTGLLKVILQHLMSDPLFDSFRLVGGTALSLQRGHRVSVDIDLFTDAAYDSIDFKAIDTYLRQNYRYVWPASIPEIVAMGQGYIIGENEMNAVKLDLYYADPFIWPVVKVDNIRMASTKEIAAMKMDVVQRTGRKKDFWDLHELIDTYSIDEMIKFHESRYPYSHDEKIIWSNLINFSGADNDFDPECLKGKQWEIVKMDIVELVQQHNPQ